MVRDGIVRPDDTVRAVLPDRHWERGSVGDVTLAELASHRSGLPKLPWTPRTAVGIAKYTFLGADPDVGSPDDVLDAAAAQQLTGKGEYSYSNLGFALLGHVLAAKTGKPYKQVLRERVLTPLQMDHTVVPDPDNGPPASAAQGHNAKGQPRAAAISDGGTPAGWGVWSTTAALARFGAHVMHGKAPGADAAKPRYRAGEDRIGYAWHTTTERGHTIVWHNGISGGCSTFRGFDRARDRVVIVLSNTDTPVDPIGLRLLRGSFEPEPVNRRHCTRPPSVSACHRWPG